jgi:hypothetical protein
MRKIRLELEDLQVESFSTSPAGGAGGTVEGHEFTLPSECPTVQTGQPAGCRGCQNSGNSSCVWCWAPDSGTCDDGCSWTFGDGNACIE